MKNPALKPIPQKLFLCYNCLSQRRVGKVLCSLTSMSTLNTACLMGCAVFHN
jgi:hypothetical protein